MSVVWARRGVLALAGLWVVVLAICFGWRIGFALELEWMEGGSLHQALRLQQGLAIYPEPSAEFVPFLYTPLYTALLAMLGWALPLDFALARVVSVAACVAVGLLIGMQLAWTWGGSVALEQASAWPAVYLGPVLGIAVAMVLLGWAQRPRRRRSVVA